MSNHKVKYIISGLGFILTVLHIVLPELSIDAITFGFVILIILPWLGPIFKSFELPGGWKVEYQEFKNAEKKADEAGLLASTKSKPTIDEYPYQLIQKSEPNLALAGLRLEIESSLRRLAQDKDVDVESQTASTLVRTLVNENIFDKKEGQVIQELLRLLNSAVNGAQVDQLAVDWAKEIGPRILQALDERRKGQNK